MPTDVATKGGLRSSFLFLGPLNPEKAWENLRLGEGKSCEHKWLQIRRKLHRSEASPPAPPACASSSRSGSAFLSRTSPHFA